MRRIRVQNPSVDHTYKSYLGADYAVADGTAATFLSNNSFTALDQLIFGEPREELTELKQLSSISGATVATLASALKFAHNKGTSIYKVLWNEIHLEADYGSGFSVITQSPIQWDNKDNETIIHDTNGNNPTIYRFRFYNTATTVYSDYSPSLTGSMPARNTVGYMLEQIRIIGGDRERKIVSDSELIRVLNRAQDIVYSYNEKWWFLYVDTEQQSTGISGSADTNVYSLANYSALGHVSRIKYRYTSGSDDRKYDLTFKAESEFDALNWDYNRATEDWPRFYKILAADTNSDKGYFQVYPKTKTNLIGTFYPCYYEKMHDLETVDDTTQVPIPAILEDYGISYLFSVKGNESKAKQYMDSFIGPADRKEGMENVSGIKLLQEIDRQQRGGVGQPKSLSYYKGRLASNSWGGAYRGHSKDFIRENYF